jgi:murein tripeptide amidase MpaA
LTSHKKPLVSGKKVEKPQFWIQGQIHAREWIGGATVQYFVHHLLTHYGKDDRVTSVLDANELIVVPCLNPDGYEYSWTTNRLWRKNRRDNGRLNGFGVDLNRNWDEFWDLEGGSSRSPFSEVYRGPGPASEPEVQALSKYFLKHKRIIGALDIHVSIFCDYMITILKIYIEFFSVNSASIRAHPRQSTA